MNKIQKLFFKEQIFEMHDYSDWNALFEVIVAIIGNSISHNEQGERQLKCMIFTDSDLPLNIKIRFLISSLNFLCYEKKYFQLI